MGVIASGALVVLGGMHSTDEMPLASEMLLKATWVLVGLGILAGSVALYGHVRIQTLLVKVALQNMLSRSQGADGKGPQLYVSKERVFVIAEVTCYGALLLAVFTFVGFAVSR